MSGYDVAKKYLGLQEVRDNAAIRVFLKSEAHNGDIDIDPAKISWCAAFINACERAYGHPGTGMLNARSFLKYGVEVDRDDAKPGDIVVFDFDHDGIHGHVAYFDSFDDDDNLIKVLGGNQHNMVCFASYIQDYVIAIRRFQ